MGLKYGKYYVLSQPENRPIYQNECLLLDSNAVSDLIEWSSDVRKVPGSVIKPLIELVRNNLIDSIEPFYGAFENCWTLNKNQEFTQENYNQVSFFRFKQIVQTVETIRKASITQVNQWLSEERKGSIDFLDINNTRIANIEFAQNEFADLIQLVIPEWIAFLSLLEKLKELRGDENPHDLLDRYKEWKSYFWSLGVPRRGIIEQMAILGFFGGTITDSFWDSQTKTNHQGKKFTREDIFKMHLWHKDGIPRVARNLAFDALYFFERNSRESSIMQSPNSLDLVKVKRMPTSIVTGDRVMNAQNELYLKVLKSENSLDAAIMSIPKDCKIREILQGENLIRELSDTRLRSPYDLPRRDELIPLLLELINRLK